MLSAGIVRSDNALVVSFVKLFLFPNLLSCILFAWTCFFIATISTGPSSWGDPLPSFCVATTLHREMSPSCETYRANSKCGQLNVYLTTGLWTLEKGFSLDLFGGTMQSKQ